MPKPNSVMLALVVATGLIAPSLPAGAESPPASEESAPAPVQSPRDAKASLQLRAGLINVVLPSFGVVLRYSQERASFEARAGVLAPSFAIGKLAWDGAATLRFHLLRKEKFTVFAGPRVGFFTITDKDEPYLYTPFVTAVGGADIHAGRWVFTIDAGVGVAASGRAFNDTSVLPVIELNFAAGFTF